MKKLLLTSLLLLLTITTWADYYIHTQIFDAKTQQTLELITIRLLQKDSTLVTGAQSNDQGKVALTFPKKGEYILVVSAVGYETHLQNITITNTQTHLPSIHLKQQAIHLADIEVKGTAAQMVVRGDTTEYNAAAFKTHENAVTEDLLKKMPGVEVDKDGKVTVNGEEIKSILVDGKKFFGNDLQMATKNIPADMIDKVQVIDDKSEMAKLTGFDDDETSRVINLTLKKDKKKGFFGNFTGAYGLDINTDSRYNANAFLNIMQGDTQTSIIAGANNTNEARSGRGRSNLSTGSGITSTENFGLNTNAQIKEGFLIGGDVSFNHSNNSTLSESRKESYMTGGNNFNNYDNQTKLTQNYDVNARLETEININPSNTIIIQPEFSYRHNTNLNTNNYTYLNNTDTISWGNTQRTSIGQTIGAATRITYNHKFNKPGRTFTLRANFNFSDTQSNGINLSSKNTDNSATSSYIDQQTNTNAQSISYDIRLSYVEPLYKNQHFLEISATLKNNIRNSEKQQYNKDNTGAYTLLDSTYSNSYDNLFFSEILEVNYLFKQEKYNLTLGARANPSQTISKYLYADGLMRNITNNVWNFAPTAKLRYKLDQKEFIRIDYRGNTAQPSIEQMEPSKNNADIMNEVVGNPTLKPSFQQSLRLMYTKSFPETFASFSTGIFGSITQDALVSNSIYDETGKQYIQTVNAQDLPINIMGDVMYNTPFANKRFNVNTRTALSYNRRVGYSSRGLTLEEINIEHLHLGALSLTHNMRAEEHITLNFTHDVIDIGARANIIYSYTHNTLGKQMPSHVLDWTTTGYLTLRLPHQWTISSDFGYTARYGYNVGDANELIWNASIDKTLFKNQATLSVKAYDMLNQRKNIREVIGDNYIKYEKYNTLPTYIMLSFTYRLNKMGDLKLSKKAQRYINQSPMTL
ncbi:MAG: TonB-dependent receptor [Paludibacteraceae bacterium]|nr:TonB-dependent receptor [Paludibacteraceae bacterium]